MNIDSMIQGNPQALVTSYNGVLVADSLEVADRFGKRHTHVLRSIDDLINQLESQSTQNWADYFIPDDYQDNKNRTQRRFKLTRDGFSLLVMGFTGPAGNTDHDRRTSYRSSRHSTGCRATAGNRRRTRTQFQTLRLPVWERRSLTELIMPPLVLLLALLLVLVRSTHRPRRSRLLYVLLYSRRYKFIHLQG